MVREAVDPKRVSRRPKSSLGGGMERVKVRLTVRLSLPAALAWPSRSIEAW